ncbi:MAG: TonB-dependent receptor plug domain-containing protein [Spongiibacteraceae bacterium]|nr:TonB-dependent receptor plug domain-containing protein [Spongiibacteraceae bacterium]
MRELLKMTTSSFAIAASLLVVTPAAAVAAGASDTEQHQYNIKQQPLLTALQEFSDQANIQILYSQDLVANFETWGLQGRYNEADGIAHLIRGLGFAVTQTKGGIYVISENPQAGYQKIGITTAAEYEADFGAYEGDERADDVDAFEIEEVIVTANRREENLQDVPMAVSVVNPDDFKKNGLLSLLDFVAYTPGISISPNFQGPSLGSIAVRGTAPSGFVAGPIVGVYLDDVPISGTLQSFTFVDAALQDIERVEFLKGPQGTLYGASSISGAIKYITRKPALHEARGQASMNLSTTKHGGFGRIYSGRLSVPVVEDKLGITVSGFEQTDSGYIDAIDPTNLVIVGENEDKYRQNGYAADLLFVPLDDLEIRLSYTHQATLIGPGGGGAVPLLARTRDVRYGRYVGGGGNSDFNDLVTNVYSGTLNYSFDWGTFTAVTGSVNSIRKADVSLTAPATIAAVNSLTGQPDDTSIVVVDDIGYKRFIQEFRLTSEVGENFDWIFGLYYADEDAHTISGIEGRPSEADFQAVNSLGTYKEYAAFGILTQGLQRHGEQDFIIDTDD